MATNAKYKLYDITNGWVEYHFTTNAGQVTTTSDRKFVTSSVTVNNVAFTLGNNDAASVTIDGSDIVGDAAIATGASALVNITASDTVAAALGKLDKAIVDAASSVPSNVVTYDSNGDVDIGNGDLSATNLTATGSVGTPTVTMGTAGSIHTNNTVDLVIETDNGGDIILSPDTGKSVKWDSKVLATLDDIPTVGTAAAKNYTTSVTQNSTDLVTSGAVWSAIDNLPEPMVFKGTIGTSGTIEWSALPSAATSNEGFTYKVITAHATTPVCAVGDVIVSNGTEWVVIPAGDDVEDTWRAISVNGTPTFGNSISTGGVNFAHTQNSHINVFTQDGTIFFGVEGNYSIPSTSDQSAWSAKYDKPSGGIPASDLADSYVPYTGGTTNLDLGSYYVKASQIIGKSNVTVGDTTVNNQLVMHMEPNAIRFIRNSFTNQFGYFQFPLASSGSYITNPETIATREWSASQGYAKVTTGTSAPSSPKAGDIWIDTSN